MADKLTLVAQHRTEFGKGFARRIRANDQIPAVLYGHGTAPDHIVLPGHETMMALKNPNALLTIDIDGVKTLSVAKDVQRHPIKPYIVHVDLIIVKKGEKIVVDVPVHLEGETAPGTIHVLEISSLSVLAEATNLPEYITVSIEGMEEGDNLQAGDIKLPQGSELDGDPEQVIVHVSVPRVSEEDEADAPSGDVVPGTEDGDGPSESPADDEK